MVRGTCRNDVSSRPPQRRAVAAVATFVLLILLGATTGRAIDLPAESIALRALFSQFQALIGVELTASTAVLIHHASPDDPAELQQAKGHPVLGQVSYWAAGSRYRYVSCTDPLRLPGLNSDVAYDGEKYQLLLSDGTLSVSPTDSPAILPGVPNPIFEFLQFRYPVTDANYGVQIRLTDVQADSVPESFWNVSWTNAPQTHSDAPVSCRYADFPGGVCQGQAYIFRVYVSPASELRPCRIERVGSDGRLLSSADFSGYKTWGPASSSLVFPQSIVLFGYLPDQTPGVEVVIEVNAISVNPDTQVSTFQINPTKAVRVWDDLNQTFVSQAQP